MRAHWGYLRLAVMGRHANRVLMEAALTVLTLATPVIAPFLTDLDADATLPPDLRFERAEQSFRRWPLPAPCKRLVLAARRRAAAAP